MKRLRRARRDRAGGQPALPGRPKGRPVRARRSEPGGLPCGHALVGERRSASLRGRPPGRAGGSSSSWVGVGTQLDVRPDELGRRRRSCCRRRPPTCLRATPRAHQDTRSRADQGRRSLMERCPEGARHTRREPAGQGRAIVELPSGPGRRTGCSDVLPAGRRARTVRRPVLTPPVRPALADRRLDCRCRSLAGGRPELQRRCLRGGRAGAQLARWPTSARSTACRLPHQGPPSRRRRSGWLVDGPDLAASRLGARDRGCFQGVLQARGGKGCRRRRACASTRSNPRAPCSSWRPRRARPDLPLYPDW